MSTNFLDHVRHLEDHRIVGMTTYPLDEILLTVLVGLLCGMDDFDEVALFGVENLPWLQRFLPFKNGIASAHTLRRALRALDPTALQTAFAAWVASMRAHISGVVAIDGKTLRGSKQDKKGTGALHIVSAYAHETGLVLAAVAADEKSNEITAIPELLDMLNLVGAVVTIDAMGTQKAIAAKIVAKKGDYLLACKGNQATLHDDVKTFFADSVSVARCATHRETDAGHGRIEERIVRVTDASWLAARHPDWQALRSIVAVEGRRQDKKTGATSQETRFYISSLPPDPVRMLAASRAHWSIENNLHWMLDVAFGEDDCRTRKGSGALALAVIRHTAFNMLRSDPTKMSLKRKRIKAALNPAFRTALLRC